jgi:DNA-binding transcriptional LysR family regulator
MQLECLKLFCDLADTQSFTKAAQLNRLTQSAISQALATLERHFNSPLVERSKRNFRLTREGQVLYDSSRKMLQIYDALHTQLHELETVVSGDVRVASDYSIGLHDLPPYVKKFSQTCPAVNLRVEYRRSNQVYQEVTANAVDLGLVAYPTPNPKLETVSLRNDPLVLICHPQNPLAQHKSINLNSLNGQRLVCFDPDQPARKALLKLLSDARVKPKDMLQFDNIDTVKRAVELDSGVALVPQKTVLQEAANKTLSIVAIEGNHCWPLTLVHKKTKVLSLAMKHFIALLKEPLDSAPDAVNPP